MKFFFVGESPETMVTRNEFWMPLSSNKSLEGSVDDTKNSVDVDDDDDEEEDP